MKRKILITSALPYANGPLHFGHLVGAYLPADCYARFQRLRGHDVLYICGSDEHGVAITLSAQLAGKTPKEHVDFYNRELKNFFAKVGISFDHYSRTTWPRHREATEQYFFDLLENDYIEERVTPQLYSESEKTFLADRYVVGECPKCGFANARGDECTSCGASYEATDLIHPRSKISNAPLILKETKHWFLLFDRFKEQLQEWLSKKEWKPSVMHFAQKYIEELKPRAITRDSDWGIPVPLKGAEGKVFYVWFDAPIGYISATKDWPESHGKKEAWKEYWLDPKTHYVQFIGKDNIPFHAVFFPAMTMGQNQPYKLVDDLPANEFLNLEGRQFSKSEGWYIDLHRFFEHFTPDQIRYALIANAPENSDAEFTWKDFQMRCNSELLGKLGNLVNRTLVFAKNNCDSKVPPISNLSDEDRAFLSQIDAHLDEIADCYEHYHLRKASQKIMELAHLGNAYFNDQKPWALAKNPETLSKMHTVIALCLHCIKALTLAAYPMIPETAEKLMTLLGYQKPWTNWDHVKKEALPTGQQLPEPIILFQKVEDALIDKEIALLNAVKEKEEIVVEPFKEAIDFDDVQKLDLRVASILSAERIPKSKKLLKLTVDLGIEKRTIVAGIGASFENLDILLNQKVMIVANLKPATLMGVQSQGMLLAASVGSTGLELPSFEEAPLGAVVK